MNPRDARRQQGSRASRPGLASAPPQAQLAGNGDHLFEPDSPAQCGACGHHGDTLLDQAKSKRVRRRPS
jgi:hypothetical protein